MKRKSHVYTVHTEQSHGKGNSLGEEVHKEGNQHPTEPGNCLNLWGKALVTQGAFASWSKQEEV